MVSAVTAIGAERRGTSGQIFIFRVTHCGIADNYFCFMKIRSGMNMNCYPIPSGFSSLDRITGGLHPSEFVVIAGKPAVGKTALALDIAYNTAVNCNIPVAFFSMEMPVISITKRLSLLMNGKYDVSLQLESELNPLAHAPLYIDDTQGLRVPDFRSKAEHLIEQKNVRLLIIDYLQLFSYRDRNNLTIGEVKEKLDILLQSLKNLAVSTGVPIIVCSQLSRFESKRIGDNWPRFSDLYDYDLFRKNADSMILIHRRWTSEDSNETKITVGKFRDGEVADIQEANMRFQENTVGFTDVKKSE